MPLTEEQKSAALTLAGVAAEDLDEATEALKTSAHPIYQKIFRGGHSTATNAAKAAKDALDGLLTTEKERAVALETELTDLKAKTPDRAAIDAQWQTKLDREKKAVQDQLDAATQKIGRLTTDTTAEKLEIALLGRGFEPRTAKLLATGGVGRISYGDDGKPVLFEPGTQIPIQIAAGLTAFDVWAEAEKQVAPPSWLVSNADSGGGTGGGGGGGGYDAVAAGKAAAATQKATAEANALAFK